MTNVRGAPSRPVPEPEKPRAKGGQRFSWAFPVTQSGANYQRLIESSGGKKLKKEKEKKRASSPGSWSGSREPTVLGIARYPPRGFCFAPTSSRPYSEFQEVRGRGEWRKGGEKDGINSFDG